jgi:hypothetical protein
MPTFHNDVQQGSQEWLRLRSGLPTASRFSDIITPSGKPSRSAERYLLTLLAERLMGHPCIEHMSMWQQRGSQLESSAVAFYELQSDCSTTPIGFVTTYDGRIGASPDRLVGDDGLLEIKCPSEWQHLSYLLNHGSVAGDYRVQAMGQLMVTERKWLDLLAFHPELPPAMIHIERDEEFIHLLSNAIVTFSLELERQFDICVERGWANRDWRGEAQNHESSEDYSQRDLISALKDSLRELKVNP